MTPRDPDTARILGGPPDPAAPRERLFVVARRVEDSRYLLVRRPGAPALTLLSTEPPLALGPELGTTPDTEPGDEPLREPLGEGLAEGVRALVATHLGVRLEGEPRLSATRHPVHVRHPYTGGQSTAYLRVVAVEVAGAPRPDALYEAVEALALDEATEAVSTDLEQALLSDGAVLLGER